MYFLRTDLGASIIESFRTFMYSLCTLIYGLIISLYEFFDMLCHGRIMDNDLMEAISFRVGLILGLIMFFRVIFSFIQYLLNPDTLNDKEKGAFNLVKKILIVIVLLGTVSYMFDYAYKFQNLLLDNKDGNGNVISRLLLPEIVKSDNFGGVIASNLFLSFYTINDQIPDKRKTDRFFWCESTVGFLKNQISKKGEFDFGYNCLRAEDVVTYQENGDDVTKDIIYFDYVFAIAVGIFVCWALLMYIFSVGVRIVQLAFLEIVAPLPIISYLAPGKSETFQKWWKMCLSTYLDVFIRIAIINFIVLIIAHIINGFDSGSGAFYESLILYKGAAFVGKSKKYIMVIIILALLTFAKKAPELIKELLPKSWAGSGDFGFSLKKRFDNMVGGKYLNKGLDKVKGFTESAAKEIGLMPLNTAKRVLTGIDSAAHGKGFLNGYNKNPGKLKQWINKQRENITPEAFKAYKERLEGKEELYLMKTTWERGASLAKRLIKSGNFNKIGEGTDEIPDWTDALDGENYVGYQLLFDNSEFANSLFHLDATDNRAKKLRNGLEALRYGDKSEIVINGKTYTTGNLEELVSDSQKADKALKTAEDNFAAVSKKYDGDARTLKSFKSIKNQEQNPADFGVTHEKKGLKGTNNNDDDDDDDDDQMRLPGF